MPYKKIIVPFSGAKQKRVKVKVQDGQEKEKGEFITNVDKKCSLFTELDN